MIHHVHRERGLDDMAVNPLLLTAMCIIYDQGKRLPHDKYLLYDRIVDTVLHKRWVAPSIFPQIAHHHHRQLRKIAGVACNRRIAATKPPQLASQISQLPSPPAPHLWKITNLLPKNQNPLSFISFHQRFPPNPLKRPPNDDL